MHFPYWKIVREDKLLSWSTYVINNEAPGLLIVPWQPCTINGSNYSL